MCVRIDRAQPIPEADLAAWQEEIQRLYENEIEIHFAAEELVLFPCARQFPELVPLVGELESEHAALRKAFSQAQAPTTSAEDLAALARTLSAHIRKEERQLFQEMQGLMSAEELQTLGVGLEAALKNSVQSCALPR